MHKEMGQKILVATVMTSVLSLGLNTYPDQANAANTEMEKCAGIVKAGMNDCAASGHTCAGKASTNSDPNEWVYVPQGSCQKIVGASIK